jgi:hypothetical protein
MQPLVRREQVERGASVGEGEIKHTAERRDLLRLSHRLRAITRARVRWWTNSWSRSALATHESSPRPARSTIA